MISRTIVARNGAFESENRMHSDAVAREYGFSGGLVPGVNVHAWLCNPPAQVWGRDWVAGGSIATRFEAPFYDGETVVLSADEAGDGVMALRAARSDGTVCATGRATRVAPSGEGDPGSATGVALANAALPAPSDRPDASAGTFAAKPVFGGLSAGFHIRHVGGYLAEIDDDLALWHEVAHPGWLLRFANFVLTGHFRLGPWIHVSSEVTHLGLVADGDTVSTRAHVLDTWERKGHELVALDVEMSVGERPVQRVLHTAIWRPRRAT